MSRVSEWINQRILGGAMVPRVVTECWGLPWLAWDDTRRGIRYCHTTREVTVSDHPTSRSPRLLLHWPLRLRVFSSVPNFVTGLGVVFDWQLLQPLWPSLRGTVRVDSRFSVVSFSSGVSHLSPDLFVPRGRWRQSVYEVLSVRTTLFWKLNR